MQYSDTERGGICLKTLKIIEHLERGEVSII